jgi:hypothetical protein
MSDIDIDNVEALLKKSVDNINEQTNKRDYENTLFGLRESIEEIHRLKNMSDEFVNIRNQLIKKLYNSHSVSAINLSEVSGLTRQMIHLIVKDNNEV